MGIICVTVIKNLHDRLKTLCGKTRVILKWTGNLGICNFEARSHNHRYRRNAIIL